jgi:hypothetical protein
MHLILRCLKTSVLSVYCKAHAVKLQAPRILYTMHVCVSCALGINSDCFPEEHNRLVLRMEKQCAVATSLPAHVIIQTDFGIQSVVLDSNYQ